MSGGKPFHLFVTAGEPSGDLLGSRLLCALKQLAAERNIDLRIEGIGGPRMAEQGLRSFFPMSELSLFGLAELLPKVLNVLKRIRQTAEQIKATQPDMVVTIDAPDFSFRVARKLQGSNIPCIHYVAPTVWAWRAKRAQKVQPLYKHLLAFLPFEPPYFERVGLPCTFVGHPLVETDMQALSVADFRHKHGISEQAGILVVLPGSRGSEIKFSLPDFGAALEQIITAHPNYRVVVPVVDHHYEAIAEATKNWPGAPVLVRGDADKYAAFRAATVALAVSGTVALELALCTLPAVIAYRIHPLTALIYRRLIKTPYANLVNIMAGAMAVPECIQENCTPDRLATEVNRLLADEQARTAQKVVLQAVRPWLSPADGHSPARKAAETILDVWQKNQ